MKKKKSVGRGVFMVAVILGILAFIAGPASAAKAKKPDTYYDWLLDRAYLLVPAQAYVGQFLETFKEYPPRQKAASFSLDKVMEKLSAPAPH
ncbi:MAG: hypothetical protein KAH06_10395 [Desulfobacterales bacterium]|nr:hypothetical protein [Desulfobacterales bacterium]